MRSRNSKTSLLILAIFLIQILAPTISADGPNQPKVVVQNNEHYSLMEEIGVIPNGELASGWFESELAAGQINLLYRQASVVAIENWIDWTDTDTLSGYFVLTHEFPVPSEWRYQLQEAGIECHSFLPPNGFSCELQGESIESLAQLDVEGIVKLDSVDKVRNILAGSLAETRSSHIIDVVLSGFELPQDIAKQENIQIISKDGRFATLITGIEGVQWLALQDEIEWLEEKPVSYLQNTVANTIINSDDVMDNTKMTNLNPAWSGLDGDGIIVTVMDSGLDSGINDATMHPDFADHIHGIYSWPIPYGSCTWNSPSDPGPCDDGADDDNGHGTHVAGSVLGDGTASSGSITGIAPEASILVHAIEQNGGLGGIPNNYVDMFDVAVENGSRIHTNSWGSCDRPSQFSPCNNFGVYSTGAMQIDQGANKHHNLVIMFAAGNDGDDYDGNGEIDDSSLLWEASAKNSITIGASENYRPSEGANADNSEGMAGFSGRGVTEDGRLKPDFVAPGTYILSTKSRFAGNCGWGAHSADYCYMGGTSMATPISAGATALLLEHLIDNLGVAEPTSALVKAILASSTHDMAGQFGSPTIGAGEAVPNTHEGNGRINLFAAMSTSFAHNESLTTGVNRGWSFSVPAAAGDLQIALAYNDPASTTAAATNLVNDLDLNVKDPSGTWTNLVDDLNNLRILNFSSPAQGTWEVHINGTSVPVGPQFFSIAINQDIPLVNLTEDADFDGVEDSVDDCPTTFGNSNMDRDGCPDTDGDGYSDPDPLGNNGPAWTLADGADAFISEPTQWADQDGDTYGDNVGGVTPDSCPVSPGTSTIDRYGCPDGDSDGFSDPDGGWPVASGADACPTVVGTSTADRSGCPDDDADGYSDPDPSGSNGPAWTVADGADAFTSDSSQWEDLDSDGYGDNPPPATSGDSCPGLQGFSNIDRFGCPDTDGDGYSDPDVGWTTANGADAFINEATQWADQDGDGYGDNPTGVMPDACPTIFGTSDQMGTYGCNDADGDGYADSEDDFITDGTQWLDSDSDGYGDEPTGNNPDMCPTVVGLSNMDRFGCPDTDLDGYSDPDPAGTNGPAWTELDGADQWPSDITQWVDADGDGFGDNPSGTNGDDCPGVHGTSTQDRNGCPDTDGDGYSDPDAGWGVGDGADAFPSDNSIWADADGDGVDDISDDGCPNVWGDSLNDRLGCPDMDGDGYSDPDSSWTVTDGADVFPDDPTQWADTDFDGYGDDPTGNLGDDCPTIWGDSWQNGILGCVDTDQDGWADDYDAMPNEPTQWADSDGDGYGDNLAGVNPDACPSQSGNSTQGNRLGCPDDDGDGWDNVIDQLPATDTQWSDQDGDGYGDNATGIEADSCPGVAGTSNIDRFGCPDDDSDGISNDNDAFPNDPTRSADTDGDGIDDNVDNCIFVAGNSTQDRTGCPDTDGDGYSDVTPPTEGNVGWGVLDGADAFPVDDTQWSDSDGDGYGDNPAGNQPDSCPGTEGYSNVGIFGCPDDDNDGTAQSEDVFPEDPTQWSDTDGDGYGDNPNGTDPDECISVVGTSTIDRFGCPDEDGDGASDLNDLWLADNSQWFDTDGDSFGDNEAGTMGDSCPNQSGTSTLGTKQGCPDGDKDGWADIEDAFPTQDSQWIDSDDDGWGDNQTAGAYRLDHWPNDPTKNAGEGQITCNKASVELDLAGGQWLSFTCTTSTTMDNAGILVVWQSISAIVADTNSQIQYFTPGQDTQTIVFSGQVNQPGNFQLVITASEIGADFPLDTYTISLEATDSRLETETVDDQTDALNKLLKQQTVQAALAGLILFVLMGTLMMRGKSNSKRRNKERKKHAENVLKARLAGKSITAEAMRREMGLNRQVPPPPPGFN